MRQISDEELLALAQKAYENRSRQQRALEANAVEACERLGRDRGHPYNRKRKVRSSSELYREENWTLFTFREN